MIVHTYLYFFPQIKYFPQPTISIEVAKPKTCCKYNSSERKEKNMYFVYISFQDPLPLQNIDFTKTIYEI